MLDLKILGTGCGNCLLMEQNAVKALLELNIKDAKVELVIDERVIDYDLLAEHAPGLLINGNLVWAGSVPGVNQIKEWLQQALATVPA